MIETDSLILDKANYSDWKDMYYNVWSHPESARYMYWNVTTSEDAAQARILRTIAFQKDHDTYLVYEKTGGRAIGFAGVEEITPAVCGETGICLGPAYVRKGYGKQIVQSLIQYCKTEYDAKEFIYSTREQNAASIQLAKSLGFTLTETEPKTDSRDGQPYNMLKYRILL